MLNPRFSHYSGASSAVWTILINFLNILDMILISFRSCAHIDGSTFVIALQILVQIFWWLQRAACRMQREILPDVVDQTNWLSPISQLIKILCRVPFSGKWFVCPSHLLYIFDWSSFSLQHADPGIKALSAPGAIRCRMVACFFF